MSEPVCQPCADEGRRLDAAGFCVDCNESLCQDCYQAHCRPRPFRTHKLLDKEQMVKVYSAMSTSSAGATDTTRRFRTNVEEYNVAHSSAEDTDDQPITKATFIRDVYVKSDDDKGVCCSIQAVAAFANGTVVVVSITCGCKSMYLEPNHFDRIQHHDGKVYQENVKTRVALYDTKTNTLLSDITLPGLCSGMTKLNESRFAMCFEHNDVIVLKVGKTVLVECRVYSECGMGSGIMVSDISSLNYIIYISKTNIYNQYTGLMKVERDGTSETIHQAQTASASNIHKESIKSFAVYNGNGQTNMYAIRKSSCSYVYHGACHKELEHFNLSPKSKSGEACGLTNIAMDDAGRWLFIVSTSCINVIPVGTEDAHCLLDKDDGLRNVNVVSYCSQSRQLVVAMRDNNYIKIYQLS